jgi:hypothetical protein
MIRSGPTRGTVSQNAYGQLQARTGGDPGAERAVLAWEEKNPHENEAGSYLEIGGRKLGPFYSMAEHALKNRAAYIRYEMDQLHDRVRKLKDVVPPEPPGAKPWWKFWGK